MANKHFTPSNQPSTVDGYHIETLAAEYLSRQNLKLFMRNFRSKRGEIDLIMRDKNAIVFVEVRYRKSSLYGSAIESVDYRKQKKLLLTAEYFLQHHYPYAYQSCRFDVIGAQPSRISGKLDFDWIKNAIPYS